MVTLHTFYYVDVPCPCVHMYARAHALDIQILHGFWPRNSLARPGKVDYTNVVTFGNWQAGENGTQS